MEQFFTAEFIKQFGLAAAVVIATLWKDWAREQRMQAQMDEMQGWVRREMITALKTSTRLNDLLVDEMTRRPCMRDSEKLKERKNGDA
jgi:hypothetical protein